jgi:hypothetical protein
MSIVDCGITQYDVNVGYATKKKGKKKKGKGKKE